MITSLLIWTGFCLGCALLLVGPRTHANPHPTRDSFGVWIIIWTLGIAIVALARWWAGA